MSDVRVIQVSAIRENPVALRSVDRESESFIGLRDSIAVSGLLNPINVRVRSEVVDGDTVEYFELIDGLHRYSAIRDLGYEEVPVNIVSLSDAEVLEAQIMANVHKVETKPVEYTKQLQRIFASNPTMTKAEMASRLAKTPSWIDQRLGLLKLEPSVQELVDDGKITVSNAVALSKLPKEEQVNFVDSAMTMGADEFVPNVTQRAKELKQAAREGRQAAPAEFKPVMRQRKLVELRNEYEHPAVGPELCSQVGVTTAAEGFALGVAYALHLDPISVTQQQAAYEEKQSKLDDAKKKRAAERAKKKADEAAEAAAKAAEDAGL